METGKEGREGTGVMGRGDRGDWENLGERTEVPLRDGVETVQWKPPKINESDPTKVS